MADRIKVNQRTLSALGPDAGAAHGRRYFDDSLVGFFITVGVKGGITFAVRYRCAGRRRTVRLGVFGIVTPEAARKRALAILGRAAGGVDEAETRTAARETRMTFKAWREQYATETVAHLKEQRDPLRYLAMAGEEWDARPLADITAADVQKILTRLSDRGTTQANRWLAHVGAAFAAALRLGHVERNPCAQVRSFPENPPRQRTATAEEEARLREALDTWPDPWEKAAFALLLDTGARLSEVLNAKREDFDLDDDHVGIWHLPNTKSGRPQAVPILPHVGAVVAATPVLDRSEYLVPGSTSRPRPEFSRSWTRLRLAAKIGPDLHIHDLRRSFGLRVTRADGIFSASVLLRHSDVRITQRVYAPLATEDRHGMAARVEAARKGKLGA